MVDALQEYLERKRAYYRKWTKANPEKVRNYSKTYRKKNRKKIADYHKEWRSKQPKRKPVKEKNMELRAILQEAVDVYGKPGGPWNVPSDPGGWISRATKALEETKNG